MMASSRGGTRARAMSLIAVCVFLLSTSSATARGHTLAQNDKLWAETGGEDWCQQNRPHQNYKASVKVLAFDGHPVRFGEKALYDLWNRVLPEVLRQCPGVNRMSFFAIPTKEDTVSPWRNGLLLIAEAILYAGHTDWTFKDSGYNGRKQREISFAELKRELVGTWTGRLCDGTSKLIFFRANLVTTDKYGSDSREVLGVRMKRSGRGYVRYYEYALTWDGGTGLKAQDPDNDFALQGLFLEYDTYAPHTLRGFFRGPWYEGRCDDVLLNKVSGSLDEELMSRPKDAIWEP